MKLVVTEKQRMGQLIAAALGQYKQKPIGSRNRIVSYAVADYIIVPLSGHVMNYVTPKELERWTHDSVDAILNDPRSLVKVLQRRGYSQALRSLALASSEVIIATDSDEEGENIGLEVLEILRGMSKPVRRLWLTTTVSSDIRESFSRLRQFNYNLARSVEARRKLDAIVGFSGTRELTLALKYRVGGGRGVISFGRVQTSTLWLVVEREREIMNFIPKPYWEISAKIKNTVFVHTSSPFFDRTKAQETFSRVKDAKQFLCAKVKEEASFVQPPKPLNTSEMLKIGSSFLHISPSKVLALAEALYLSSIITYPRVDNQAYSQSFNQKANLQKLSTGNNKFNDYAAQLLSKNLATPTQGRFSEDHEPITPIASILEYQKNPLAYHLYELILRHYLAIFGPRAKFLDTTVEGSINEELFRAEGRRSLDRGFYSVYYYPPKEKLIDSFHPNTKYLAEGVSIIERKTQPPPRHSNSSLLAEMEKEGIGTKSTRPTMIETLKERQYVRIDRNIVYPADKGMKLISCIEKPWGNYISPKFTSRVEEEMEKISRGEKDWEELVDSERRAFADAVAVFRQ